MNIRKPAHQISSWGERWEAFGTWVEQNVKKIFGVILLALVVFGVSIAIDNFRESREQKLNSEFYRIEKKYLDLKKDYEKRAQEQKTTDQKAAPNKDKKAKELTPAPAAPSTPIAPPDYAGVTEELKTFALKNKTTRTGKEAALLASRLMTEKDSSAGAALREFLVQFSFDSKTLIDFLGENLKAQVLANQNACNEAAAIWKKLIAESKAQFLWAQAQLGVGLCAEKRGDLAEAKSYYNQAIAQAKDSASARSSEKYLRKLGMSGETKGNQSP